jgi:hypothetical protein
MQDWLPADHVVRFAGDVVDRLDLGAFYRSYRSDGSNATAAAEETAVAGSRLHVEAIGCHFDAGRMGDSCRWSQERPQVMIWAWLVSGAMMAS